MTTTVRGKDYYAKWRRSKGIQPRAQYLARVRRPGHCPDCNRTKPPTEFNRCAARPSGYQTVCKDCQSKRHRAWRERLSPADRERLRQTNNAATKRYRRAPMNKIKVAAHMMVAAALKIGLLTGQPCRECGRKRADAHHADYTKPLDVVWLCRRHHKMLHVRATSSSPACGPP